jgi:hypothetical protein
MKPIVIPKYDIGLVVKNCNEELLNLLEPFCSNIYVDYFTYYYIQDEQKNTLYDLNKRVLSINAEKNNDIEIRFNAKDFTETSFQILQQLPEILANDEELEIGSFELDIFEIQINKIKTYEGELIK